ncbi:MAG: YqeG family HAD IIIA-type phosphatase [Firmicutes bacterium]|nr:YqeG family HAD IIIA-type phosphatase [Bacillota bacterium]
MFARFLPTDYVTSIYHIDLRHLWDSGVRGLVTDLDNTLVAWGALTAPEKLVAWLDHARELGFAVCILSNNHEERVARFAAQLGIPALARARKPRTGAYHKAMALIGTTPAQTAMIGDQLFTDVWGGNRLGIRTILVTPVPGQQHGGTTMIRRVERVVLRGRKPLAIDEYFTGGH